MSGMAILENVCRYRTIASLYRQTAAFSPTQKLSLLAQAFEYSASQPRRSRPITWARLREIEKGAAEGRVGSYL
jgi:hypothetical protein